MAFELIKKITWNGAGVIKPSYMAIHSTANVGASALNHVKYWTNNPTKAVNYVVDWTKKVYNCVEWNHKCYGTGGGNSYCVDLEICETKSREQFNATWEAATQFVAWFLKQRGWGVDRVISHDDARKKWGGTDHTDPIAYFGKFGKTMNDFRSDVAKAMGVAAPSAPVTNAPAPAPGKLTVDGSWGKATTRKLQEVLNTGTVDGIVSNQPSANKKYVPSQYAGWEWKDYGYSKGSMMIKALQKRIGADVDGWLGPNSVRKLQSYLTAKGYKVAVDGYFGPESCKALQRCLNDGKF